MTQAPTKKESLLPPLWILSIIGVVFALWMIVQLKEIVVLLVVGYSIAYAIDPILDFFERKKVSRGIGLFFILAFLVIFLIVLALTALPTLIEEFGLLVSNLPHSVDQVKERIYEFMVWIQSVVPQRYASRITQISIEDLTPNIDAQTVKNLLGGAVGALLHGYSITLTIINLILLPFIVFYIAMDFSSIYKGFVKIFPKEKRKTVEGLLSEMNGIVSAFVRGQALVAVILFLLYTIGLSAIGVKLWFLLAVISGFGNLVPYVGTISGILLSSLMALVTFGDFHHMLYVWILYAVIPTIDGFWITPKIVGSKTGFSPLVIILALFAGASLFGLLGVFLAIPAAAVLKVLGNYWHRELIRKLEA